MMKLDPVTIGTLAVLFLILIIAATQLRFSLDNPEIKSIGSPLHKNTGLQLKAGELYIYTYSSADSVINLTYEVHEGPGCTLVTILETDTAVCLDAEGERVAGPDGFGDPTVLLFKPWMLALNDSWRWNSSVYLAFNNSQPEQVSDISYRVIRRESYLGREAFVVEVKADDSQPEYEWVDAEKRVMLRMLGEGYEVVLDGPPD